jgi:hypothetical protein
MKRLLLSAVVLGALAIAPVGAAETWTGTISDSMCSTKHSADKHGDKATSHRDCVEKCINNGGEYVFLSEGKVFKIANQDFKDLKAHAAHQVMLTGEMKGDTITVAKIEMPKSDKK